MRDRNAGRDGHDGADAGRSDEERGYASGGTSEEWRRHDRDRSYRTSDWRAHDRGYGRDWDSTLRGPRSMDEDRRRAPARPSDRHDDDPSPYAYLDRGPGAYGAGMAPAREADYGGDRERDGGYAGGAYGSYGSGGDGARSYGAPRPDWGRMPYGEAARIGKGPKGYTRSDERIKDDVSDRLESTGADWSDVEVSVTSGEVTLTGTVVDRRTKFDGEHVAASVRGVKDVHNQLRIASPPARGAKNVPGKTDNGAMTSRTRGTT